MEKKSKGTNDERQDENKERKEKKKKQQQRRATREISVQIHKHFNIVSIDFSAVLRFFDQM